MRCASSDRGFTFVEVLVAMAIGASAAAGVAALMSYAATRAAVARAQTMAAVLAAQKIEQLTSQFAQSLALPASGSLERDEDGYFDRLDTTGMPVAGDSATPSYVRRWSVSPQVAGLCAIQVVVMGTGVVAAGPVRFLAMSCGGGA